MINAPFATVWGGAGEHGRSCYFIQSQNRRLLLDCGVKKEGTGQYPLLPPAVIPTLDAVFLSHAHEDHSMALPLLYKLGFHGKVWATRATVRQLPGYFSSWKRCVAERSGQLPYQDHHIEQIRFAVLEDISPPNKWSAVAPDLEICWGKSGHMMGSVWLILKLAKKMVFYSGDFSAESNLLAVDWPAPDLISQELDLSIIDTAYGIDEEDQASKLAQLDHTVRKILRRAGSLLLPVPARGRGQELLVWANETFPRIPIIAESELIEGLRQMLHLTGWLQPGAAERIKRCLANPRLVVAEDRTRREKIMAAGTGSMIFTCDGMMESDTAQRYYHGLENDPRSCVVLTGHQASGSFGNRLLAIRRGEGQCEIVFICYKVHQGIADARKMLARIKSKQTVLVHAGKPATDAVCRKLSQEGYQGLYSLTLEDSLGSAL